MCTCTYEQAVSSCWLPGLGFVKGTHMYIYIILLTNHIHTHVRTHTFSTAWLPKGHYCGSTEGQGVSDTKPERFTVTLSSQHPTLVLPQ